MEAFEQQGKPVTKRQATKWEKILEEILVMDKGLISKVYKELIQLNI